jgi:hypothetical protein
MKRLEQRYYKNVNRFLASEGKGLFRLTILTFNINEFDRVKKFKSSDKKEKTETLKTTAWIKNQIVIALCTKKIKLQI